MGVGHRPVLGFAQNRRGNLGCGGVGNIGRGEYVNVPITPWRTFLLVGDFVTRKWQCTPFRNTSYATGYIMQVYIWGGKLEEW